MQSWGVRRVYQHGACLAPGNTPIIYVIPPTTWNPLDKNANVTLSNGNLTAASSGNAENVRSATSKASGKWYFEITATTQGSGARYGFANASASLSSNLGSTSDSLSYAPNGSVQPAATNIGAFSAGAVLMFAVDLTAATGWFGVNGVWNGNPATTSGGFALPSGAVFAAEGPGSGGSQTVNFGTSAFAYSVPSGFLAWG